MPIPSISFRLAIVSMVTVLGAWFGYFSDAQHNILIMHFSSSVMGQLVFIPLPFAVLAAFIGWNKGYFKKTYAIIAGLLLTLQAFNAVMGTKFPRVDMESVIMSVMILVTVWFVYELVQYVKAYLAKQ